jgi:hypothetical protein
MACANLTRRGLDGDDRRVNKVKLSIAAKKRKKTQKLVP